MQLEEGQWKDHKKKIDELQKKINAIEKNQEYTVPQEKLLKELDEKNKQVNLSSVIVIPLYFIKEFSRLQK